MRIHKSCHNEDFSMSGLDKGYSPLWIRIYGSFINKEEDKNGLHTDWDYI